MQWLKHAFAIEPAHAFPPSEGERKLIARLGHELQRRRLILPATVLLESVRPLGSVASQALIFSTPWLATITDTAGIKVLSQLLARPGAVDWILDEWHAVDEPVGPSLKSTVSQPLEFSTVVNPPRD